MSERRRAGRRRIDGPVGPGRPGHAITAITAITVPALPPARIIGLPLLTRLAHRAGVRPAAVVLHDQVTVDPAATPGDQPAIDPVRGVIARFDHGQIDLVGGVRLGAGGRQAVSSFHRPRSRRNWRATAASADSRARLSRKAWRPRRESALAMPTLKAVEMIHTATTAIIAWTR